MAAVVSVRMTKRERVFRRSKGALILKGGLEGFRGGTLFVERANVMRNFKKNLEITGRVI